MEIRSLNNLNMCSELVDYNIPQFVLKMNVTNIPQFMIKINVTTIIPRLYWNECDCNIP
jgi:hypothetical protein